MQGLIDIAKNFDIGTVMLGSTPVGDAEYDELMRVARERSIPVTIVRRGDELKISGVTLRILNPITNMDPGSANNSSIVMKIEYSSRSLLMTGDIERTTEADLVAGGLRRNSRRCLKSCSSRESNVIDACVREMLRALDRGYVGRATVAIGHPHPEVVERWSDAGAQILRTGEKGNYHDHDRWRYHPNSNIRPINE
jgi:competence protein ComEC